MYIRYIFRADGEYGLNINGYAILIVPKNDTIWVIPFQIIARENRVIYVYRRRSIKRTRNYHISIFTPRLGDTDLEFYNKHHVTCHTGRFNEIYVGNSMWNNQEWVKFNINDGIVELLQDFILFLKNDFPTKIEMLCDEINNYGV